MRNVTLKVEGMHCDGCTSTVQALPQCNGGVQRASASWPAMRACSATRQPFPRTSSHALLSVPATA